MALNPYTLYSLYDKRILEYVPTDLLSGSPMGAMMPMSNPYLDMAKQGGLYQNHGACSDTFLMSDVQSPYVQNYQTSGNVGTNPVQIGSLSNAGGMNVFNGVGVGTKSPASAANAFGFNGVIGAQSPAGGLNTFGGFTDTHNNISAGFNKAAAVFNNTPKFVLGVLGAVIGVGALATVFKRGKKPSKTQTASIWSKLNPKNWFNNKK